MDYGNYETGAIRFLIATPYSSVYGLLILTVCLVKSFPVVTMSGGFSLPRFYQTVQDYKVTHSEGGTMTGILMEQTAAVQYRTTFRPCAIWGWRAARSRKTY